jgi:hypothetical protein
MPIAPRVPTLQFENRRERGSWRWLSGSVLAHALIIIALVVDWSPEPPFSLDVRTPGDAGPLGGGGGGGAERISYVDLPAWEEPAVEPEPQPQRPEDLVFPTPEITPIKIEIETPRFELPRVVVPEQGATVLGRGAGTGGGPGAGTGTGGGVGSGRGTGIGSHTGPGTGGEGGNVFPPAPRFTTLPGMDPNRPGSVRGKKFVAQFVVAVDGRVESVEIRPQIRDAAYRRKLLAELANWRFDPGYTREGVLVRAGFLVTLTL